MLRPGVMPPRALTLVPQQPALSHHLCPPLPPAVCSSQDGAAQRFSKSQFLYGELQQSLPSWCYWPGSDTGGPLGTCFSSITVDQLTWGSMCCRGKL